VRDERRLFQYQYKVRIARAALSQTLHESARASLQLPRLSQMQTGSVRALRSWNAEGWYVVLDRSRVLAFTSEYHTMPPKQITDVFYEIQNLPARDELSQTLHDVCMGFCYEPVAALAGRD